MWNDKKQARDKDQNNRIQLTTLEIHGLRGEKNKFGSRSLRREVICNWKGLRNLPVGATGGSSTKLVAGIGISSWPPEISSQTSLKFKSG